MHYPDIADQNSIAPLFPKSLARDLKFSNMVITSIEQVIDSNSIHKKNKSSINVQHLQIFSHQ